MDLIKLPKVEFHRHLDGSVRPETLWDLAKPNRIDGVTNLEELRERYIVREPSSLAQLLEKFDLHQRFFDTKAHVRRIAFENVEDVHLEGVVLSELRFAPIFMVKGHDLSYGQCTCAVLDGIEDGMKAYPDTEVGLILIAVRGMPLDENLKALEAALVERDRHPIGHRIVGFDLAATEEGMNPKDFLPMVELARSQGLKITVHTGEDTGPKVMRHTIEVIQPDRIGHGVRSWEDPELLGDLVENNLHLELSVSSNYITGAVDSVKAHPIGMFFKCGVPFSINTDDPHLMGIDLVSEYQLIAKELGFTPEMFREVNLRAIGHSFLPTDVQEKVAKAFWKS